MTYNKNILLSMAMFIACFAGNTASGQNTVYDIDRQIRIARNEINALREGQPKRIHNRMMHDSDCRFVYERHAEIEKLRRENEELISRARDAVRRANRGVIFIPTNAMIFSQFGRVPGVSSMGAVYSNNRYRIRQFEQRQTRANEARRKIKLQCDSAMYEKINLYQLRIDSLLNKKIELTR